MTDFQLVLALSSDAELESWIALAKRLLPEEGGTIHLRALLTVEAGTSLSEGALGARTWRDALGHAAAAHPEVADEVHVFVDYQPFLRLLDDAVQLDADLLLAE